MRMTFKRPKDGGSISVSQWLFLGLLLNASLFLIGCNGNSCPDWNQALKKQASTTTVNSAPSSVKATNDLIVYLDTSGSMAGYLSRDGQSTFGKTLRELRVASGTFASNSDVRVLVRHVGSNVGSPLPDMDLSTASQDPSVFKAGETDLAGAIASFKSEAKSIEGERRATPQPSPGAEGQEPGPPARFHILVTDGVQSTKKGSALQDCTAGSDQFCVRQKIGDLLKAGWGGCVLGIRADFHGKVYSEVTGAPIPYDSKTNDPTSYRPFYLYVFSPDPPSLDSLVKSLKERLRPLVTGGESIRELNLSFPYVNGFAEFDVSVPKESRDAIKRVKDRGGPPQRFTIHVDVDETVKSGPKPFLVTVKVPWSAHGLDTGNNEELARLLSWTMVPVYPASDVKGERFPEITITGSQAVGSDGIGLQAKIAFPPGTAKPSCRVYRLEGRLNFTQATPAWIQSWSTNLDTTREVGNRTFSLETALLGLWNNSSAKDQVVAEAYLRVGP